ncbi:MAG: hypothetical protein ACR2NX_16740 [Chthoniobacterales bacterium]
MRDAVFGEELAATGFGAEMEELRVGPIHVDAEAESEVALEDGGVVADEVGAVGNGNEGADLLDQTRAFEELGELSGWGEPS